MKKTFRQFEPGSSAYVIAHGLYMASRGKNPSVAFLTEKNPRKALVSAKDVASVTKQYQHVGGIFASLGAQILKQHKPYHELEKVEVEAAARHIITTSGTEEEVVSRLENELGCKQPMVSVLRALTKLAGEAKELCLALGGLTMKDGSLIQVMFYGPDNEFISL